MTPPESATAVDAALCPLCGQSNACAAVPTSGAAGDAGACWCMTATLDRSLLERVPSGARGLACICARCAAKAAL